MTAPETPAPAAPAPAPAAPAPDPFAKGSYVKAKLVPLGHYGVGVIASVPYPVAHFAARKLIRSRLQVDRVPVEDVPHGLWVSVHLFETGYYEVPLAWVRPAQKPTKKLTKTAGADPEEPEKAAKKPRTRRKTT